MSTDRPRLYSTEAVVLKQMPLGEADRLLTLYTPHHGKVRAMARGVRRVKSRLGGNLEPLTRVRVLLAQGKTFATISQADTLSNTLELRDDLWRMTCGLYIAELVDHFAQEEQENLALYRLLEGSIATLANAPDPDTLLRFFESRLLALMGFLPELHQCASCGVALAPATNSFSPAAGGALCPACRSQHTLVRPMTLNALKVLRLFSSCGQDAALGLRVPEALALELEHLLRQYIRYILERDVRSTEFLDMLRREMREDASLAQQRV